MGTENFKNGGIGAKDIAVGIEREHAGGDIFEYRFDELAAAFEFLDRLLKVASELIDLRAGVAELGGHGVEGADENAELVVALFRDLVIEIAGGDFAGAFGKSLN